MLDAPNNTSPVAAAPDWKLARTDKAVRAALLVEIEGGRFSCETAARATGVGSNVVRVWQSRHRRAASSAAARGTQPPIPHRENSASGETDAEEVLLLAPLPDKLVKRAGKAASGREAKAFVESLAVILDLRRRATGRSNTLEKSIRQASPSRTFVTVGVIPLPQPQNGRPTGTALAAPTLEAELVPSRDGPPGLEALLAGLPEWQRNL